MSEFNTFVPYNELLIVGGVVDYFDDKVDQKGLICATKDLIQNRKAGLEISCPEKSCTILANEPVVIVANHRATLEILPLIAALPDRDDLLFFATPDVTTIGPNTTQALLPVHITDEKIMHMINTYKLPALIGAICGLHTEITDGEPTEKNSKSLRKAIRSIRSGGMVGIFPQGPRRRIDWYPWIGMILSIIRKCELRYYVQAYVRGASDPEVILKLLIGKMLPPFKDTFSEPQKVSDIVDGRDVDALTAKLNSQYIDWINEV